MCASISKQGAWPYYQISTSDVSPTFAVEVFKLGVHNTYKLAVEKPLLLWIWYMVICNAVSLYPCIWKPNKRKEKALLYILFLRNKYILIRSNTNEKSRESNFKKSRFSFSCFPLYIGERHTYMILSSSVKNENNFCMWHLFHFNVVLQHVFLKVAVLFV